MPSLKKILVPLDFSPCSESALLMAAAIASAHEAKLELLHVHQPPRFAGPEVMFHLPGGGQGRLAEYLHRQAKVRLEEVLARYPDMAELVSAARVISGLVFHTILETVDSDDIDMVVMGTHGRAGLEHVVLGSVAEKIVRHAPVPVLTTRFNAKTENALPERPGPIRRILAPIDFSDHSQESLKYALFLGERLDAQVDALHVYWAPADISAEMSVRLPGGDTPMTLEELIEQQAIDEFERFLSEAGLADANIGRKLEHGKPTRTISDYADRAPYDLVVLGSHGRTGIARLFLGSVAEKVVRYTNTPVLTVRV